MSLDWIELLEDRRLLSAVATVLPPAVQPASPSDGQDAGNNRHDGQGDDNDDQDQPQFNFADLLRLSQNFGKTNATAAQGDLNGDGVVNFADLLILAQHFHS